MSDTTPAQAEAEGDTQTVTYFDREWTIPSKVRLSHMRALRRDPSNVGIVDAFLSPDDLAALDEIDPDEAQLDAFTDEIGKALGFVSSGNS
jgi:hypothetical protein